MQKLPMDEKVDLEVVPTLSIRWPLKDVTDLAVFIVKSCVSLSLNMVGSFFEEVVVDDNVSRPLAGVQQ